MYRVINNVHAVHSRDNILSDLRNEIDFLKEQNKRLARELHAEKYVQTTLLQQETTKLRADNYQAEQEAAAIRFRVGAITRQAVARENLATIKREQTAEIQKQTNIMNEETRDVRSSIEAVRRSNEILSAKVDAKKMSTNALIVKLKEAKAAQENKMADDEELDGALKRLEKDVETEKHHLAATKRQETSHHVKHDHLLRITQQMRTEKEALSVELQKTAAEESETKQMLDVTQKCFRELKQQFDSDFAQYEGLVRNADTQSVASSETQTDHLPFPLEWQEQRHAANETASESGIGPSIYVDPNDEVRGRGIEVRTRNYEKYVDINIRILK